jgi:hypothetical protein
MAKFRYNQEGETKQVNTAWFRGKHTNFLPSREELYKDGGLEKYIFDGWLPDKPFISKETPIITIGSCFAREVAGYLSGKGYAIQTPANSEDPNSVEKELESFNEGVNNTFALRQLFEWVFEDKEPQDETWHRGNQTVIDRNEEQKQSAYDRFSGAEVFVFTLGLSEVWENKETGDVFWRAVPYNQYDERKHGFRVSTVEENKENLKTIIRIIEENVPNAKIIFTLSPVPLIATFRPINAITATSVSKAVLRIAIDETYREHEKDNIFYWPSYEMVKEYGNNPYQDDNRHIYRHFVYNIMDNFARYYVK